MFRLVWLAALIATVGIAFSPPVHRFRELHHTDIREFLISLALAEAVEPIVVFGDSITERHALPPEVCGHPVVNAGIGGLRTSDFDTIAPRLLAGRSPFLIVIALGANDRESPHARADYLRLIEELRPFSMRLLSVSVAPDDATVAQIRDAAQSAGVHFVDAKLGPEDRADGIHLNAAGYARWLPAVTSGILDECTP
jgi:lysophospholipase L1-like esterase